jgi:hypothetical protein
MKAFFLLFFESEIKQEKIFPYLNIYLRVDISRNGVNINKANIIIIINCSTNKNKLNLIKYKSIKLNLF